MTLQIPPVSGGRSASCASVLDQIPRARNASLLMSTTWESRMFPCVNTLIEVCLGTHALKPCCLGVLFGRAWLVVGQQGSGLICLRLSEGVPGQCLKEAQCCTEKATLELTEKQHVGDMCPSENLPDSTVPSLHCISKNVAPAVLAFKGSIATDPKESGDLSRGSGCRTTSRTPARRISPRAPKIT